MVPAASGTLAFVKINSMGASMSESVSNILSYGYNVRYTLFWLVEPIATI